MASMVIFYVSFLFLAVDTASADRSTIVVPGNKSRTAVGYVFLPGAQIGADQYLSLGKKIQRDSPYSLWLATVGGWIDNTVNPLQMSTFIADAIQEMQSAGLPKDAPMFLAAHSLGGVFLDMYVRSNPSAVSGVVLYGSYVSKSVKLKDYPVPVLTVSGDQDGLCRMTRIIMDYGQLQNYTHKTPVIIVPGVNHSQVASGAMPSLVENNDLIADCTEDEAHALLSNITNSFITLNGPPTDKAIVETANNTLKSYYKNNSDVAQAYLQAVELDAGGFPSMAQFAATILSDVTDNKTQLDIYGRPVSESTFMETQRIAAYTYKNGLNMSIPMHNVMPLNPIDISLSLQSPNELYVKTLSKKTIQEALPNATFAERARYCNDTNSATIMLVKIMMIPDNYNLRYQHKGIRVEFGPDVVLQDANNWLATDVSWKYTDDKKAKVVSPFYTNDDILMCKVVTMSRAIEWMLIDAFKKSH